MTTDHTLSICNKSNDLIIVRLASFQWTFKVLMKCNKILGSGHYLRQAGGGIPKIARTQNMLLFDLGSQRTINCKNILDILVLDFYLWAIFCPFLLDYDSISARCGIIVNSRLIYPHCFAKAVYSLPKIRSANCPSVGPSFHPSLSCQTSHGHSHVGHGTGMFLLYPNKL